MKTSFSVLSCAAVLAGACAIGPASAQPYGYPPYAYPPIPPEVAYLGDRQGPGTFAAPPRSYGGDPRDWRNVPTGVAPRIGCYGGREQVVDRFGQLVWVPNVTCDGN
ncbi:MAG: hypothetical protein JWN93_544 [Hyphomicrobiales bacterium]|nr:hypothetical protein [Hyphomicrobiales bacterium]